jgi:hypothetical protein
MRFAVVYMENQQAGGGGSLDDRHDAPEKAVAIVQSNYIPWKGYFDLIRSVDEFVILDDVQYTRRDWRNRNRLKSPDGVRWLSIPVEVKGRYHQRIDETLISDPDWARRHWTTLSAWYGRAPCFRLYRAVLEELYLGTHQRCLSQINRRFLEALCGLLKISTPLTWSSEYCTAGHKTERLLGICLAAGATRYVSGPSAHMYLDESRFRAEGIEVVWMSYDGYPEYPQLHAPFEHRVSVLDLLLNVGDDASSYMTGKPWTTSRS